MEGLWPSIEGDEKMLATGHEAQKAWKLKNHRAFGLSLSDNFIHRVEDLPTSKDAYKMLDKLFGAHKKNSKISLQIEFCGLVMQSHESFNAHVIRIKSLMNQLAAPKANAEEDVAVSCNTPHKSMPNEIYKNLITTLKNLPSLTLKGVINSFKRRRRRQLPLHQKEELLRF